VNKPARVAGKFGPTVKDVASKLNAWPVVLQLPIYDGDGKDGDMWWML
jgi:elongation factor G